MPLPTDQKWSDIYSQGRDFQLATSQEIDRFLAYISIDNPKTCLDIGCGTGQLSRELYHRGYKVVGIDASSAAIEKARKLTSVDPQQLSYAQVDIEQGDLSTVSSTTYGLVTCKLVYAFIKDKPAFLEKIKGVLAPQGLFVVITPLIEDVEAEKRAIAVNDDDMKLLKSVFEEVAVYKDRGLAYFVGRNVIGISLNLSVLKSHRSTICAKTTNRSTYRRCP